MPDWNDILNEIKETPSPHDIIRRQYLEELHKITGRNIIIYYSGWLQRPGIPALSIDDNDKIGFMSTIHELNREKGLDLILHTPGGDLAATESLVSYLRDMFDSIRAIIPQLALSAGTMISCACDEIIMGKQSSLGPIDPQFMGLPAHGILEEFEQAHEEIQNDQSKIPIWQPIIAKYNPTLVGECQKAIKWSEEIVKEWLVSGMLKDEDDKESKADRIILELGDHSLTKSHARHIPPSKFSDMGLKIEMMEDNQELQDAILSLHHACIHTLSTTNAAKIIENHKGKAMIQTLNKIQ